MALKTLIGKISSTLLCLPALVFASPDINSWTVENVENIEAGEPRFYSGRELYSYIDGGADIFYEYGFLNLLTQDYTVGDRTVTLEIYQMMSDRAAFGIYSYRRHPDLAPLAVGDEGQESEFGLSFWQDGFYVRLQSMDFTAPEAKKAATIIARAVCNWIGTEGTLPNTLSLLPTEAKKNRSEVLIMGNLGLRNRGFSPVSEQLRLEKGEEGALADYELPSGKAKVLTLKLVSKEKSLKTLEALQSLVSWKKIETLGKGAFVALTQGGEFFASKAKGTILGVVFKARDKSDAVSLLEMIGPSESHKQGEKGPPELQGPEAPQPR